MLPTVSDSDSRREEPGEGVIRFRWRLDAGPPVPTPILHAMQALHAAARARGLTGRDAQRYEGLAFGNLSVRDPEEGFWISASQRIDRPRLDAEDLVHVVRSAEDGTLMCTGTRPPSSESLCHDAVYRACRDARVVIHGHHPRLWRAAGTLGLAQTAGDARNGTRLLAQEVVAIVGDAGSCGLLAMAGHEDGILAWADHDDGALALVDRALDRLADTEPEP
ncbi:MAG: class II aldolase/adducin family protein [Pseudomonadales bacterium]|jgi:hypothetical protein|nr:class II aldolase/adducin family protein [Pseudomonadales bacterium]